MLVGPRRLIRSSNRPLDEPGNTSVRHSRFHICVTTTYCCLYLFYIMHCLLDEGVPAEGRE
jgi:hypothetical protein